MSPEFGGFQEAWKIICESLSKRIPSGRLRLSIECFVQNCETQKSVLRPLLRLPKLCHLRLNSGISDTGIEKVSKSIADSLITRPYNGETFPFERLPPELQQMVVSHSDLVAKRRVGSNPKKRLESARGVTIDSKGQLNPVADSCCGTCDESDIWCWCNVNGNGKYSTSCSCPRFTVGLFSANKHIAQLAFRAFYGENQLHINGLPTEITSTLSSIPSQHLRYVKRLCFDGNDLNYGDLTAWQNLFDYVYPRAHPDLAITIIATSTLSLCTLGRNGPTSRLIYVRRLISRLGSKRVSVLAPLCRMPQGFDRRDFPCHQSWVTLAGPAKTPWD
ncbi:hypothetical protein FQN54_006624 [Arachnomyces sp. PD_36]|nr:hypothetical protein FQN54_006624 [Arachnomyces sp. PD_36]